MEQQSLRSFTSKHRFFTLLMVLLILAMGIIGVGWYVYQQSGYQFVNIANRNLQKPEKEQQFSVVNSAFHETTLNYLYGLKKDILSSSVTTNSYNGRVLAADLEKGEIGYSIGIRNVLYDASLKIQGSQKSVDIFYYTSNDLGRLQVVRQENGQETPMSFTDLKANDEIAITETIDLLKPGGQNRTAIKIIKFNR